MSSGFTWVNYGVPSGRRVHPDSRRFTWARLGFVGIIGVRVGSVVGFIWVHVGSRGRTRGRRVHSGSHRCSLAGLIVVGSFGFAWVYLDRLGVVEFIRARVGS